MDSTDADATKASDAHDYRRLVVVSNRLPVVIQRGPDGEYAVGPGHGGLVTALAPVLRNRGGLWVGWPGTSEPEAVAALDRLKPDDGVGYDLVPVPLEQAEVDKYYYGFSNEIIWPLFHDLIDRCSFDPDYWPAYQGVNEKFARVLAEHTGPEDFLWIQDYQLMLVAQGLRQAGVKGRTGFFLHIPFPPLDIFARLPWRQQVLEALLHYDLLGFQTVRDRRNFMSCVRALVRGARTSGRHAVNEIRWQGRTIHAGSFPISIDTREFSTLAHSSEVADRAWFIHEALPERQLIFGIDRLDYTKGIPHRIRAVAEALERYPDLRGKVTFIQVVVPSRVQVPEYRQLKAEIEQLVGQVNGRFTHSGWTPIHYIYRPLKRSELVSYYRTCEIALVTPLKDGMNLIAKEYCTCSVETGVLLLSEFAGAAAELHTGALLVNPYDLVGTADALHRAATMDHEERRARMRKLRRQVGQNHVFRWVDTFLKAAIARNLDDFPRAEAGQAPAHFRPQY